MIKMETKEKHKLQRRIFVLLLFALLPTCCTGDKVFRNVLYWEVKPYIYHDTDGNLTGIFVDANNAVNGISIEMCDHLYPGQKRYNTFIKKSRREILHMYKNYSFNDSTEVLFPVLYKPRDISETFFIKSEGIAVITLRNQLENTLKFMFAFSKMLNLFILTAICVLCSAITMLIVVRTSIYIMHVLHATRDTHSITR